MSSWCFKFEGKDEFMAFQELFGKCLYEYLNAVSWEKAKVWSLFFAE